MKLILNVLSLCFIIVSLILTIEESNAPYICVITLINVLLLIIINNNFSNLLLLFYIALFTLMTGYLIILSFEPLHIEFKIAVASGFTGIVILFTILLMLIRLSISPKKKVLYSILIISVLTITFAIGQYIVTSYNTNFGGFIDTTIVGNLVLLICSWSYFKQNLTLI